MATKRSHLIRDGVLERYVLGSYSARKLGLQTTGNAGGVYNLQVKANAGGSEELLAGMRTGLLVTELMGQGLNLVTGDYSRGAAGFWVENFSSARGEQLIQAIERVSLPVFAVFFASAGAKVNLGALATMWPLALLLSSVRAAAIWAGIRLGTLVSRSDPVVARYTWLGFISQAGVALSLAAILGRAFPEWGDDIQILIIAMIALHELIGPIGFQHALRRAGEVGQAPRLSQTPPLPGSPHQQGPAPQGP